MYVFIILLTKLLFKSFNIFYIGDLLLNSASMQLYLHPIC